MEIVQTITLTLSALLLVFVGTQRLRRPIQTYAKSSGIHLDSHPSLLNEMRGVAAVMLCAGLLMGLGIIVQEMRFVGLIIGALVFLGFAFGRIVSMRADGQPSAQIRQGLVFELVLGTAHVYCLIAIAL